MGACSLVNFFCRGGGAAFAGKSYRVFGRANEKVGQLSTCDLTYTTKTICDLNIRVAVA